MSSISKLLLSGSMSAVIAIALVTNAAAGWMDKINQVTGRVNQTSQQIQQIKQTKQQAEGISASLPKASDGRVSAAKPSTKNSGAFALTKTKNPVKGEWGTQEKSCTHNSSTCASGMTDLVNCMHQAKGYYYRLVAANLQGRVDNDQDLTDDDRTMLEEDITSLNEAVQTDKVVDPDPQYPQRYMAWLAEEDQHEIQKMNSKYMNEVRMDCDQRFGGMAH